jgi:acyl CoA:acetate/3-ketoacid CoA transferase alpha subunit
MAEKAKRREVVASVEEAARLIQPGMTIMLGGFGTVNDLRLRGG